MPKAETRVVTAHLPISLADKIEEIAKSMERSRGWVMKQAVSDFVALEEERRRLTLQALASTDAGHLIDDEDMRQWVYSLKTDTPLPLPKPKK